MNTKQYFILLITLIITFGIVVISVICLPDLEYVKQLEQSLNEQTQEKEVYMKMLEQKGE